MFDHLIVGAGCADRVLAERLADAGGKSVLLVEKTTFKKIMSANQVAANN
jgi:choline dehydrogenase-like flavoprotein